MIDYNVKTRLYLAQHQPGNADLNLAADDRRAERFNHSGVIVSNIENIIRLFFVFWKLHSKSTWLKNRVVMNETHLSVFHSVSNRARGKHSRNLPRLAMLSTHFFSLEQETSSLHDLTDYYVERATAPHYKSLSFMFS